MRYLLIPVSIRLQRWKVQNKGTKTQVKSQSECYHKSEKALIDPMIPKKRRLCGATLEAPALNGVVAGVLEA